MKSLVFSGYWEAAEEKASRGEVRLITDRRMREMVEKSWEFVPKSLCSIDYGVFAGFHRGETWRPRQRKI